MRLLMLNLFVMWELRLCAGRGLGSSCGFSETCCPEWVFSYWAGFCVRGVCVWYGSLIDVVRV